MARALHLLIMFRPLKEAVINRSNRENVKHKYINTGLRQGHGGRERFPIGEWGVSSEVEQNNGYREADSYDKEKERPFEMDDYYSGRQFSVGGMDFDQDERDELNDREHNRSRFAETYRGGQYTGKGPKGYKRSDEKIHEEACEALYRNPSVDASDIEVKVKDGLVSLSGTVNSRFAKRQAENCIENLPGVQDIQNELHLEVKKDQSPQH